jgi:hypothetical protein
MVRRFGFIIIYIEPGCGYWLSIHSVISFGPYTAIEIRRRMIERVAALAMDLYPSVKLSLYAVEL